MDGYACFAEDLVGASEGSPVTLPVVGESAAGQTKAYALTRGQTVKIMTGAPMPTGADAVVPVEWTDAGRARVEIRQAPKVGQHVRPRGDDIRVGDALIEEGVTIGPREAMILAATGYGRVKARPRPRVVVISTGSELREPGTKLGFDSIYDSNSFAIAAAARQADAIAYRVGIVSDDPQELTDTLSDQLVRADLVVTSGGVSKGDYDVVKDVLSKLGTVEFAEVAMQPGKPQGFGTIGEDDTPIFTLPGNPVSSYISFEVFVLPAIRRMMGKLPYRRPLVRAELTEDFSSPAGRKQFVRGIFEVSPRGAQVRPVGGARLAPDRQPRPVERPDRGRGRRPRRSTAGEHRRRAGPGSELLMTEPGPVQAGLTHVDESGAARMVDVSAKDVTAREAVASGRVSVSAEVVALLRGDGVPKGDALGVARIAGIMAAKKTPDLVPLCHPLALSGVVVDLDGPRRCRRDHRDGAYDRSHRRRDGGADCGVGRRVGDRRHGQGRRQGHRDRRHQGVEQVGWSQRRLDVVRPTGHERARRPDRVRAVDLEPRGCRRVRGHDRAADRAGP